MQRGDAREIHSKTWGVYVCDAYKFMFFVHLVTTVEFLANACAVLLVQTILDLVAHLSFTLETHMDIKMRTIMLLNGWITIALSHHYMDMIKRKMSLYNQKEILKPISRHMQRLRPLNKNTKLISCIKVYSGNIGILGKSSDTFRI